MEGSTNNCRGDGCKCQVSNAGDYCSDKCKSSNDYGHCHCGHAACTGGADEAQEAAHEATQIDEKIT